MIKLSVVPIVKFDAIRTDSIWVWAIKSGVVISGGPFTAVIGINGNNMIIDGLSSQSRNDSTHCAYFLSAILLIKRSQRFGEDTLNFEVSWRWWLYFRGERLSEFFDALWDLKLAEKSIRFFLNRFRVALQPHPFRQKANKRKKKLTTANREIVKQQTKFSKFD